LCEAATRQVRPYAGSDSRDSGESDLVRFEEDASPAPRAAECARFFPLLLGAGIVGGRGVSACVTGGRCGARQDEDAAYCGYTARSFRVSPRSQPGLCSVVFNNLAVLFNGRELCCCEKAVKRLFQKCAWNLKLEA
jgi:hypothetical protein